MLKVRSVNYSWAAWTLGNLHQTERHEFTLNLEELHLRTAGQERPAMLRDRVVRACWYCWSASAWQNMDWTARNVGSLVRGRSVAGIVLVLGLLRRVSELT
jgi:hypothetical protein